LPLLSVSLLLSISCGHAEEPASTDLKAIVQNVPAKCQAPDLDFKTQLYCAQTYFLINGKPINPMIVKDLSPWISDSGDQVVSINLLDSQKSNRYFFEGKNLEIEDGGVPFSVKVTLSQEAEDSLRSSEYFIYKVLGKTANGIFVLKVIEGGGGSGIFSNLLFVRIREDKGFDNKTLSLGRKRVLIETLGTVTLGDRVYSTVTIKKNSLLVETEEELPPHEKKVQEITL
jgi:hypothetical protein